VKSPKALGLIRPVLGVLVRGIDFALRRYSGIREFSSDPDCILRISVTVSKKDLFLSDGTAIRPGDKIGEMHLWNERIPPLDSSGPGLAWGLVLQKRIVSSLRELATYVREVPEFRNVQAFRARLGLKGPNSEEKLARLASRFGFEMVETSPNQYPAVVSRLFSFFDNLYASGLMLTFNPESLRGKRFWDFKRPELWISTRKLMEKYGVPADSRRPQLLRV